MKRKNFSYARYGYIFSIPFVLAFLIFALYPLVYTVSISFTDRTGVHLPGREYNIQTRNVTDVNGEPVLDADGNQVTKIAPFENIRWVLNAQTFRRALRTTFEIWIVNFIPQLVLAIVLAAWFTSRWTKIKGQGLFKVLFYMPNIITAGSIAALFMALFMFPKGAVNDLLIMLGIIDSAKNFAVSGSSQKLIISFIQFWMWYGYTMLIVISGIIGLNPQMYESADIDGASAVKQFFYITLPNLKTILLFILVTSVIGGLNMFDIPMLYADGGPAGATSTTSVFIYRQAFAGSYRYNIASAASVVMFVIIAVLSAVLFYILRDKDAEKLKKMQRAERRAFKKAAKAVD